MGASIRNAAGAALLGAALFVGVVGGVPALAQQPFNPPEAGIIVTGDGTVTAAPYSARISGGVTTRAGTAVEATEANAKLMTAVTAALRDAGVEQKDIQTVQFSVAPYYAPQQANSAPKLAGFTASNQVSVTIRQLDKLGAILDKLVAAGATDVGNVGFLHSDEAKLLDQARTSAIADARRKADIYAQAAGIMLGGVAWITEESGFAPPGPMMLRAGAAAAPAVPISPGEDTLHVRVTVGFALAHQL